VLVPSNTKRGGGGGFDQFANNNYRKYEHSAKKKNTKERDKLSVLLLATQTPGQETHIGGGGDETESTPLIVKRRNRGALVYQGTQSWAGCEGGVGNRKIEGERQACHKRFKQNWGGLS